ncbi:hypothetical protein A7U60_g7323 [Sanghuangporus baumii]|uniref:Lipoyl-binding domain-containing protein n=1 Tax=Sanghuangporus baumii TaxID=108892 RepID=A0A9Q5HTR3_SANBA|nr:hypothetical protein A7U60_g7323 [Sanghuangporus baumii]
MTQTQGSSLTQRIQFLEAKGLTPSETEEVMKQASFEQNAAVQATPYYPPYQYRSPYPTFGSVPPLQQPLDWRDYFIMAVVSGSFMFGAVSLARKYLMPHLRPPSSTAYEEDRDALTEQFDAAEKLLKEIQAETAAVRQAVDEQKAKVDQTTQEVEACVKEMREGETRTRDEMQSQSQSLGELQQELKSLKALLMSRGPTYPTTPSPSLPSFVGRPSIPAWQLAGNTSRSSSLRAPALAVARRPQRLSPFVRTLITKRYTSDHEAIIFDDSTNIGTVSITNYAQESLGDVVFVELPSVGTTVATGDQIGAVESVKAASDIVECPQCYSPVSGTIEEINQGLADQPGLINKSAEDKAWLCKIKLSNPSEVEGLMDAETYKTHCESS